MKAPSTIETARLVLRRPTVADAPGIFDRYAGDAEVTRFLGWPRHRSVSDTRAFLEFCEVEWEHWPAGPYLVTGRETGVLLGSTGFAFETPARAATGYVMARDAWGKGYATEAFRAVVALAPALGVRRLYALCHTEHVASRRILEKCGFAHEGTWRAHTVFPNLGGDPLDVLCYVRVFPGPSGAP